MIKVIITNLTFIILISGTEGHKYVTPRCVRGDIPKLINSIP